MRINHKNELISIKFKDLNESRERIFEDENGITTGTAKCEC